MGSLKHTAYSKAKNHFCFKVHEEKNTWIKDTAGNRAHLTVRVSIEKFSSELYQSYAVMWRCAWLRLFPIVSIGISGQANIALMHWVEGGSSFIFIQVTRALTNRLRSCKRKNSRW